MSVGVGLLVPVFPGGTREDTKSHGTDVQLREDTADVLGRWLFSRSLTHMRFENSSKVISRKCAVIVVLLTGCASCSFS